MAKKVVYQVREKIGPLYHVYTEFKEQKDAIKHISKLMNPSNFDIPVVHIEDPRDRQ